MKNKYLNKFLCITTLSAMVLSSPAGVMAAEETGVVVSNEGEAVSEPAETETPEPEPTAAPEPIETPAQEPAAAPEPTPPPKHKTAK